ncbi:hypothetical protein WJX81_006633 [Elliptochloris bilobata]|uniref:Uncharacterized protein n=1 Tax=Elliptochloris bilobata TaxID=381761 RepID=A0AAW1RTW2_9CHLO
MGIPVTRECALPGCEALNSDLHAKDKGMYFDVSVLFTPRSARRPPAGELWACCKAHKAAALREALKEMPFLSLARQSSPACDVPEQLLAEA